MSCCCNKILKLCKVNACEGEIKTQAIAAADGLYKLVFMFLDNEFVIELEFEEDAELNFPVAGLLNEHYVFTGHVLNPDGEVVEITVDDVVYNCVSFETVRSFQLN